MTRGTTSILYLFDGAFSLWRRRLKGVYAAARERGWHVEPVNADDEGVTSNAVLHFWRPDGVIVDGAALGRSGFSLADFKDIPIVYCDANEEILAVRVREAKRLHDQMEQLCRPFVDFTAADRLAKKTVLELFGEK